MSKLIALFALLLIIAVIIWAVIPDYEKCYSDRELEGYAAMQCCKGLNGGTKDTDYLSEMCIGCPHYVDLGCNQIRKEENNENN